MSVLKNVRLFVGEYDLTTDFNQVEVTQDLDELDATTYAASGTPSRVVVAGFKRVALSGQCFLAFDSVTPKVHDKLLAKWAAKDVPTTVIPEGGTVGDAAHTFLGMESQYQPGGPVGQLLTARINVAGSGSPLILVTLLEIGSKNASGNGAGQLIGAVAAGQKVYAALHLVAISGGGTLTMKVQSDDAVGFASPTDRITFAGVTAVGCQWASTAGAITDTYWRASWTLTAGTANLAVVAGIL